MIAYRLATKDDYENINSFHNRIYKSNRTPEEFAWEFVDGPFGPSIYVIAEDNGKVVGTNCVIPIDLVCADKKVIRTGKSEDTLVDPDYRGQNIFFNIYEFLFEKCREAKIKVIWGFTAAKKPFLKLGFEIPFDHEQCLAVNHILTSYRYLSSLNSKNKTIDKLKILGLCIISKLRTTGKKGIGKLNYRVEENPVIEGVSDLIFENQSRSGSVFAIHQTPEFQDWRLYKNPNYHKIHTFGFYNNEDRLMALIVFSSHRNKTAYICQATFHPTLDNAERIRLLKYATKKIFNSGIALIRNWLFDINTLNHEEILVYKSAGYTHLKRGIGFVWKKLDTIEIEPTDFYLSRISTQGVF